MKNPIGTAAEILRSIAEPHNSPRSRVEVVVELLDNGRASDLVVEWLRQGLVLAIESGDSLERCLAWIFHERRGGGIEKPLKFNC